MDEIRVSAARAEAFDEILRLAEYEEVRGLHVESVDDKDEEEVTE
jgi:hypothetical protein